MLNETHPLWLVGIGFALGLLPVLLGSFTSYLKISIVLSMLRSGLGTQQVPSALVVMALSLAITCCLMAPELEETYTLAQKIDFSIINKKPTLASLETLKPLHKPWSNFIERRTGQRERAAVADLMAPKIPAAVNSAEVPLSQSVNEPAKNFTATVLAFLLTELKQAFIMGFVLLVPFLVIDLVVANVLVGMGMMMVSPVIIALPLKLLIFVLADGWLLFTQGIIHSYAK